MTGATEALSARAIRERVGHPLVDGDGHLIEVREAFVRFVEDRGGSALFDDPSARALMVPGSELQQIPPLDVRKRFHTRTNSRWFTTADTQDYAAVTMPALMHERLADTGFDFSVVFPTYGLHLAHIAGDEARRGLCRLYNEMVAEDYGPFRDRLSPVAVVPLHTPEEGLAELEHAHSLGLGAYLIPSFVWRTIPAFADAPPEYRARLRRMDAFGIDSEHDYDPFWERAVELNAPLAAHMSGAGLIDRISPTNYVYSAGQFAATGEALAKSLFLGGVLHRFPGLRVGLMEGGVAVGVRLYGDLVGRWEKRGPEGLLNLDLRNIDTAELARMAETYQPRFADLPEERLVPFLGLEDGPTNDFALSGVDGPADIRDQFCNAFFWGCEGDDPLVAVSFDPRVNPLGATVPAFVGSDIGHWDVPNFEHPLREAYEQIEHGLLTAEQFREFTLTNAVRFYAGDRLDFFAGTAVEGARARGDRGEHVVTVMEESGRWATEGRVAGKVAIVTGSGQVDGPGVGTGKATAILLARHGADVVLVDREPERAEVTRSEITDSGGRAVVVEGDVTNADDCVRMTQAALDEFGRLDVLINNVGVSRPGSVVDLSEQTWDDQLTVNLKSVYLVSRPAIPAMADTGGGSIVNISSIGALRSIGFAAYSAAKGGMISLSQEMAAQHGPDGIRVNVVVPASIQTPRTRGATQLLGTDLDEVNRRSASVLPLGSVTRGTGWDIAYAALFFASDESSWITGQVLAADGGASVTLPAVALAKLDG